MVLDYSTGERKVNDKVQYVIAWHPLLKNSSLLGQMLEIIDEMFI